MKVERIAPTTIRAQIYEQLKNKIISAEFLPGEVMTLQRLADGFGVSLMPVREALWQLESQRVIVIESNKRIYVNRLTVPEIEDILRLRLVLEQMAGAAAARRRPDGAVRDAERSLRAMEASLAIPRAYMRANSQFHFGIYAHADSPMLLQQIRWLWMRIGPYFVISSREEQNRHAMRFHRGMYAAFTRRDPAGMRRCVRGDLRRAATIILAWLKSEYRQDRGARRRATRLQAPPSLGCSGL